jgi:hypothetical protein
MKYLRAYLMSIEDKINYGHGAYWWVQRKKILKIILECQLLEFNHD